ncbi:sodium:proton antiporter [Thiohalocapsa marina]|uniref:Sodium:proton antiporter n=1 Tax=Thiohalocapsa marina TaxID=424902 RepID=A0A5M8FKF8_9GAMM|nr:sodium:proton antiporter [Thiohalocapsa marina]KAA6185403.1 sodium:proton antiporter [Thiohalocapsa marina]
MNHLAEILALLVVVGIGAQWLGWRLQIPSIVLLALCGLVIGPVLGLLRPSEALGETYQPLIKLAVAAILFEGGLSLRLAELRQAASAVRRLVSVSVLLVLAFAALAAHLIAGLSWPVALIFGAIAVVTGPTVILPLLRQARLNRRPASVLKWEGIVNDPVGAVLVVVMFDYFVGAGAGQLGGTLLHLAAGVGVAVLLGGVGGWLLGRAFLAGLVAEYLKGPVALAAALGAYALSNLVLEEAGLIAATVMGIVLGNMNLPSIGELRRFKEDIAVILVSIVFLVLTADLDPAILSALDWRSLALIGAVIFLVRPAAVWLATLGTDMTWQERLLVGWIAPRGIVAAAVAGVFGPALAARGLAGAEQLLPLVFALILSTVVLHGFTLGWLARRLGLSASRRGGLIIAGATAWSSGLAVALHQQQVPVVVADNAWHRLRAARLAGVPVFFGELLSEQAEVSLELGAYGSLLAATGNDAYNALVCAHFAPELGRQQVFQLAEDEVSRARRPAPAARGRHALAAQVRYEDLQRHWYQGWGFHCTGITDAFAVERLRATLPPEAIPVLVIGPRKQVRLIEADKPWKAESGEQVLWFGCRDQCALPPEPAASAEKPRPLV